MSSSRADAVEVFAEIALRIHEGQGVIIEVLELIASSASQLLRTDIAWLALTDPELNVSRPVVLVGFRTARFLEVSIPSDYGIGGQALARRSPVTVEDYLIYDHPTTAPVRSIVEEEGLRSLVCCPMFRGEQAIGVLFVARRRPSKFRPGDVRLLEALAAQAAVAIENQRLYSHLITQNELLERSNDIHDRFTETSLRGVGLVGIAQVLAELTNSDVRIAPSAPDLEAVQASCAASGQRLRSRQERITANNRVLGWLEIRHSGNLSDLDVKAVEHARTICGFELVKLGFAAEVERRYSSRLLDELLDATTTENADVQGRAKRLKFDLEKPCRVLVVAARPASRTRIALGDAVQAALATQLERGRMLLMTERAGRAVVAVQTDRGASVESVVERIREELARHDIAGVLGIGPLRADVRGSHQAADACASFGLRLPKPEVEPRIVRYDDLGLLNFVLDAASVEFTARTVSRLLDPLIQHDRANRLQLIPTLRAYLAAGGHHNRTCEQLFIAVTTLKYRLGKIGDLLQVDLRAEDARFELRVALDLWEMLGAVSDRNA